MLIVASIMEWPGVKVTQMCAHQLPQDTLCPTVNHDTIDSCLNRGSIHHYICFKVLYLPL